MGEMESVSHGFENFALLCNTRHVDGKRGDSGRSVGPQE